MRSWGVEVGVVPNPSSFPDGKLFGKAIPHLEGKKHVVRGVSPKLFAALPKAFVKILHEHLEKTEKGGFKATDIDEEGNLIHREEGSKIALFCLLNQSAANLGPDVAPDDNLVRSINGTWKDRMTGLYALALTANSTCNARTVLMSDYFRAPANEDEQELDEAHDFDPKTPELKQYLADHPHLAHYIDLKVCTTFNARKGIEVFDNLCEQRASVMFPDMFPTIPTGTPKNYNRRLYDVDGLYGNVLHFGLVSSWEEVPTDSSGKLHPGSVVFFNEGFTVMPFLLTFAVYKKEKDRVRFLSSANSGDAVTKIYQLAKEFDVLEWYSIEYDDQTDTAKFVIDPWMTDKHLAAHNLINKKYRLKLSNLAKKEWNRRESAEKHDERKKRARVAMRKKRALLKKERKNSPKDPKP